MLFCGNGQIAIFQMYLNFVFLEAGQVNVCLNRIFCFSYIGTQQMFCVLAIQEIAFPEVLSHQWSICPIFIK